MQFWFGNCFSKGKKLFYSLYVTEMSSNFFFFFELLPIAYYTVSNIVEKIEQPISLLFAYGRYNHMFLSDSDLIWEPD